jgi:hypothetical protein
MAQETSHSHGHVQQAIIFSPVSALINILITSILFGLPVAYLAYKKDIETATASAGLSTPYGSLSVCKIIKTHSPGV